MNESQVRQSVINTLKPWIGLTTEHHEEIVDIYNSHSPKARGYTLKYSDAWCAATVSAASIKLGFTDIMPTEVGALEMFRLYQSMGRSKNRGYIPVMGDIVFFYSATYGYHTAVAMECSDSVLTYLEGNGGDGICQISKISLSDTYIYAFGTPDYASKVTVDPEPTPTPTPTPTPAAEKYIVGADFKQIVFDSKYDAIQKAKANDCKVFDLSGATVYEKEIVRYRAVTDLYMRKSGGSIYPTVGVIPTGGIAEYLGQSKVFLGTTWYYLSYNDVKGWSSSKYLMKV